MHKIQKSTDVPIRTGHVQTVQKYVLINDNGHVWEISLLQLSRVKRKQWFVAKE